MDKLKRLEQLQSLKANGSLTEEEFNKEKEKLLNDSKESKSINVNLTTAVICIILIVVIGAGVIFFVNKNKQTTQTGSTQEDSTNSSSTQDETKKKETKQNGSSNLQQTSANAYTGKVSFNNMNSDDSNLNDVQKEIIKYFDNDYFYFDVADSQRYPQVFKGAKVKNSCVVTKVLKSSDDEFKALVVVADEEYFGIYAEDPDAEIPEEKYFIIEGKQLEERLMARDLITIYGRYDNIETMNIDGKSHTLPKINIMNVVKRDWDNMEESLTNDSYRCSVSTIKTVAEHIFGKDIKIGQETTDNSYIVVTLDNQANSNFKCFDFDRDYGIITYDQEKNNLSDSTVKRLFIASDFEHYIVTTYDNNLKHIYIEYFDKDFKKLWSREFDFKSNKDDYFSPIDYTDSKLAFVIDTDLHLLDLKNGENIIEPIIVGNKSKVNMMEDGIVLVGTENKDTVVKVDYNGKIMFRVDGNTKLSDITSPQLQIVNDKIVIGLSGFPENVESEVTYNKYLVVSNDGKIEVSTKDLVHGH